jgi:Kef-type K+ transport system membrane component KefB
MRLYGASPLHLAAHVAVFGVSAYALAQILQGGMIENFLIWFAGAALLHDLVFLPLYAALDGLATRVNRSAVNYLRVPALISGLLLLVYFPLILVRADGNYLRSTGHHVEHYTRNWLLITAALFAASGVVYLARRIGGGSAPGRR